MSRSNLPTPTLWRARPVSQRCVRIPWRTPQHPVLQAPFAPLQVQPWRGEWLVAYVIYTPKRRELGNTSGGICIFLNWNICWGMCCKMMKQTDSYFLGGNSNPIQTRPAFLKTMWTSITLHPSGASVRERFFGQKIWFHFSTLVLFGLPSTSSYTSLPKKVLTKKSTFHFHQT